MTGPVITLLTDFGLRDPSAAILHGVVLGIAPDARLVDISHEVRKFAIRDGALLLWCALPYLPVGFHVAVVDPGVGTDRRPVAIATGRGDVLVGPDNGLLIAGAERLGGIRSAHLLEAEQYRLPVVSTSFHGRDIFAPAAAHLARGVPIHDLGRALDPSILIGSPILDAEIGNGELRSSAVYIDTFGNVKLAGLRSDLEAAIGTLRPGDPLVLSVGSGPAAEGGIVRASAVSWQSTFSDVALGESLVYEDSYGRICLAARQADAAAKHGIVDDVGIVIRRA